MFDLEANVQSWSDYLRARGALEETDLLELESHLRDQIDDLTQSGLNEEEAFLISVKRLGSVSLISEEYSKVNSESLWKYLLLDPGDPLAKSRSRRQIVLVILFSLLAGTAARIPTFFGIEIGSLTYFKNLSFYILPLVALFLTVKHGGSAKLRWVLAGIFAFSLVVVNFYPSYEPRHTETLTAIHLPILLWLVTGLAYMGRDWKTSRARMDFLRFTGESVIYGSLLLLGLMVLIMFTMFIFQSISIDLEPFVENYLLIYGGCAVAMLTVYLVEAKKSIVENFAPILAKIFSPLFLLTMLAFLVVMIVTGSSPFTEREFLIGFDLMLVVVLGLVLYTISAKNIHDKRTVSDYLNVALIAAAIIVDGVALSAILFRLSEYGITPNKLAALGENVLLLINLAVLLVLYVRYFMGKIEFQGIEIWQTRYLTVYALWMGIVVFVFPLIFRGV
ncbi:MAG: permease prefix domain 1-containing protein [Bacillota bacterium]|nr:permease prefix domain 1-containing protein [Bacillota bacterium]HHT91246.1 hypothetical protein [Bacillota bacterium]